ncbi:hypothetical protein [Singulisphaera sp. PoT]|uniref:hypothetical protein n=1 Tax=Singulisphaera sp. PoT TaxID=3411797 RepID=UPI003BF51945
MATASENAILLHKLDGRDETNAPIVTTIHVLDASMGGTLRYKVGRSRPDVNGGEPYDLEPFDAAESAEEYADGLAAWTREEFRLEEFERREARAQALRDLAAGWYSEDPARAAVLAIADAIASGREADILAALANHDPMPQRRGYTSDVYPRRRQADSSSALLDDLDVIAATGSCG